MSSNNFEEIKKVYERLNKQLKPALALDKQFASTSAITQSALKNISMFTIAESHPTLLVNKSIYESSFVKNVVSPVSDILGKYPITNIDNNMINIGRLIQSNLSQAVLHTNISGMTQLFTSFASAASTLMNSIELDEQEYTEPLDDIIEIGYSNPTVKKLGKETIQNLKETMFEHIDSLNEAIDVIDNKIKANKVSKFAVRILLFFLSVFMQFTINQFLESFLAKPVPVTVNYTINNYYNKSENNELLNDIETIQILEIQSLAVINDNAKIYHSNSLKSGVCSRLSNGQLVCVLHKNKKWCLIEWVENKTVKYGWVQNYHLNKLIIK